MKKLPLIPQAPSSPGPGGLALPQGQTMSGYEAGVASPTGNPDDRLPMPPGLLPQMMKGVIQPPTISISSDDFVLWFAAMCKKVSKYPEDSENALKMWAAIEDLCMRWLNEAASQALTQAIVASGSPTISLTRQHEIMVAVEGFWLVALHQVQHVYNLPVLPDLPQEGGAATLRWRASWNTRIRILAEKDVRMLNYLIKHEQPAIL